MEQFFKLLLIFGIMLEFDFTDLRLVHLYICQRPIQKFLEYSYVNILCQPKIGDICCFVSIRPWTQGTVNQNRLRPTHHKKISSGTWEIFGLVFDRYKDGLNVSLWNLTLVLIMHTYRVQKHLKKIKCTELFFWRISKNDAIYVGTGSKHSRK